MKSSLEMVKKSSSRGPREGAAVPTCEAKDCGKRPWTDWRPNFQKYLCADCNKAYESRAVRFERHGRRNHPATVVVFEETD